MTAPSPDPPDPVALLLADHRAIGERLARLREALPPLAGGSPEALAAALGTLRAESIWLDRALDRHIEKEEAALFPALQAVERARPLLTEMLAEHEHVALRQRLLAEALTGALAEHGQDEAALRAARSALDAALTTEAVAVVTLAARRLLHVLRVHFRNEERHLFPLVPDVLGDQAREQMAAAMQRIAARPASAPPFVRAARPAPMSVSPAASPVVTLADALASLRATERWRTAGWATAVLAKQPGLTVSALALRPGARFRAARVSAATSLQVIAGAARLTLPADERELAVGSLLPLPTGAGYTVEALTDTALVLTVASPV